MLSVAFPFSPITICSRYAALREQHINNWFIIWFITIRCQLRPIRPKFMYTACRVSERIDRPGLSRLLPLLLHCVIALVFLINDIVTSPAVSGIVKLEPGFTTRRGAALGSRPLRYTISFLLLFSATNRSNQFPTIFFFAFDDHAFYRSRLLLFYWLEFTIRWL